MKLRSVRRVRLCAKPSPGTRSQETSALDRNSLPRSSRMRARRRGQIGTRLCSAWSQILYPVKSVSDAIYFLCADRIAREVAYQTIIVGELLKHGKQIMINGKDYVHNPENKLTLTMLGAFAEFGRAKIIERTTRGRLHRLRMGELSSTGS